MKWLAPTGSVQRSADGKYMIMQANSKDWVAYAMSGFGTTGEKVGERGDPEQARACCEVHSAEVRV